MKLVVIASPKLCLGFRLVGIASYSPSKHEIDKLITELNLDKSIGLVIVSERYKDDITKLTKPSIITPEIDT